jgi:LPXTG-site transpeptidase (sortase) family protein
MGRDRRVRRDRLAASRRGRPVVVPGVFVTLLAVIGVWAAVGRSTGTGPSDTRAPAIRASTPPPTPASQQPAATRTPTTRPQASPTPRPVKPKTNLPATRANNAGPGAPRRILLPQIGVTARVIRITARGGSLMPPSNPRVVGWWSGGALPGARIGSAVMTAHTVHTGGGAFDDLDKLRVGAIVTVITSTGRINYVATSTTNYPKRTLAKHAAQLFDQTTRGRLVLVTCEDWNGQTYLSNAVVIAQLVR